MAQVMFTSADDLLAAYLSGEIDHHFTQMLRQQINAGACLDARPADSGFRRGDLYGLLRHRADFGPSPAVLHSHRRAAGGAAATESIKKMLDLAHVEYQ